MLVVYIYVYLLFLFILYIPNKKNHEKIKAIKFGLSEEDREILDLLGSGLTQKEAGFRMDLSQAQVNNVIKRIRKKTGYESLMQVMFNYGANFSNQK